MAMPFEDTEGANVDESAIEFSLDVKCTEDQALEVLDTDLQPIGQHMVQPVSVKRGMADKPITILKLGKGQVGRWFLRGTKQLAVQNWEHVLGTASRGKLRWDLRQSAAAWECSSGLQQRDGLMQD
jgi:hypothetical protein